MSPGNRSKLPETPPIANGFLTPAVPVVSISGEFPRVGNWPFSICAAILGVL